MIGVTWTLLVAAGLLAVPAARHDQHVSHTRLVVEGATLGARMRLFRDDLEKGLAGRHRLEAFDAVKDPRLDSLFAVYVNERFLLEADGARLRATVESSGVEMDTQQNQQMVWFVLEYAAAKPVRRLSLRNVILQEQFGDQQNIVQVMHLPDEARQTLYFAPGDAKAQELRF
ncbi:MAG TPA: DUF6702 family protein [Gemmatimonadales bacterium]|nr:DUF6702 family protein [Gemmatimonadales bacterium]